MKRSYLIPRYYKIRMKTDRISEKVTRQIAPNGYIAREPHPDLRSRDLFKFVVAQLAGPWSSIGEQPFLPDVNLQQIIAEHERNSNDDLIAEAITRAERMQFADGHFRRSWKDRKVKDRNTVEFCMRDAGILYKECGEALLNHCPEAWRALRRIFARALPACLKRRPPQKFTNIALMNALNLMVLGDILNDQTAISKGIARFERIVIYTWEWGIHENLTRVYTSIQADCLGLIRDYGPTEEIRKAAQRLLLLTWANAAASDGQIKKTGFNLTSPPEGRIAQQQQQPNDRELQTEIIDKEIDFPGGMRAFWAESVQDMHLADEDTAFDSFQTDLLDRIFKHNGNLENIRHLLRQFSLPRLVRAKWGPSRNEFRTHYVCPNISLMSISARYDFPKDDDIPLTVDFSEIGQGNSPNLLSTSNIIPLSSPSLAYLMPGVAKSPYDRRAKRHEMALWTAAQTKKDALALALYKPRAHKKLETSFVLPLGQNIELFKNDKKINSISNFTPSSTPTGPQSLSFEPNDTLTLRYEGTRGPVAVAIKIPWARNLKGEQAARLRSKQVTRPKIPPRSPGVGLTVGNLPQMIQSKPLVSVIMPAHNAQKYITRAIESILNQTYRHLELIVIDDASTDKTSDLIAAQADPRIKYIRREECGCSGVFARNDGLAIAGGAFIAVADADDISLPNRLQVQIDYMHNHPHIDLLGGGMQEIDLKDKPLSAPVFKPSYRDARQHRKAMLQSQNVLIHGTLVFRRQILDRLKGYNPFLTSGDTEFLLRATRYFCLDNLTEVLIKRRIHPASITHTFGKRLRRFVHPVIQCREYLWAEKQSGQSESAEANLGIETLQKGHPPPGNDLLVSVVMASHNSDAYIKQAIESILYQTYARFEFIIVDDASTDNTPRILEQYTDSRITILRRSECACSGSSARNDALALARGDLIAIADADDINLPHRFEKQVTFFNLHPKCDLLGAGIQPIDAHGQLSGHPEFKPAFKSQKRYRKALLNDRNVILHPTLMFRKRVFDRLGTYSDFAAAADYEYFLRASRYFNFHNLRTVLVHYRRHKESVTHKYGKFIQNYHHSLFHAREYVWVQKQIEASRKNPG